METSRVELAHGVLRTPIAAVAAELLQAVGAPLVAVLTGVHLKTVRPWARGDSTPHAEQQRLLREALKVVRLLRDAGDSDDTIQAWFRGMNPYLDDAPPALELRKQPKAVLEAAEAFAQSG